MFIIKLYRKDSPSYSAVWADEYSVKYNEDNITISYNQTKNIGVPVTPTGVLLVACGDSAFIENAQGKTIDSFRPAKLETECPA